MDEFIEQLNSTLHKKNIKGKKINDIPIIDEDGNYLISDKILIKPYFIKKKYIEDKINTYERIKDNLTHLYIYKYNNYVKETDIDTIQQNQKKLKDILLFLQSYFKEDNIKKKKELEDKIKEEEIKLLNTYNNINHKKKDEIKMYLLLKMDLQKLKEELKNLEHKKKVSIVEDIKYKDLEHLKVEYLNSNKTLLSSNRIELEDSKIPKKSLKKDATNKSILKKKGSMKNTKGIQWHKHNSDGTELIDNSKTDLNELKDITSIDLDQLHTEPENEQEGGSITEIKLSEYNNDLSEIDLKDHKNTLIENNDVKNDLDFIHLENKHIRSPEHSILNNSSELI